MFRSLVFVAVLIFASASSFAATIQKVKGKSVLIDMKGDEMSAGDTFYSVQANGKRTALIKISKVKGSKALGKTVKGNPQAGQNLEAQPAKVAGGGHAGSAKHSGNAAASRAYWGGMVGYGRDSMDVNVNGAFREKASLSGSGLSAKGLFDYEVFPQVWFRFTTGLEMFKVSGPAKCATLNSQTCDANINYLSLDFMARYVFGSGMIRPWGGAFVGLLFPMSKSASALQAQSISTTNVLGVAGGVDIFTSPSFYVPVSIEYGLLPKSDEVAANWITFRVGFAVPF